MPDALAIYRRLAADPGRFDFFQALRLIECANPDRPRIGHSRRAAEDPVRFGQSPSLSFAPTALDAFDVGTEERLPRLTVHFFGLIGPNGPLPLHLTEYVRDRVRNSNDPTFARFLDLFHHRLLSIFYRAWASAQPTVSLDRGDGDDRFSTYLGSLFGLGSPALRNRDALPDAAKLHYAGLLANQARSADGLKAILGRFLSLPVRIVQFVGHWLELPAEDHSRLGRQAQNTELGLSTVLGVRVWSHQHKFRIVIGAMGLARYQALLPGGAALRQVAAWVRNYAGDVPVCEVQLILEREDVPVCRLGHGAQLGWTSWLPGRPALDADDIVLTIHP
ncbi:MAG: type VI secretion system baseplate subunit TssG [Burkholderiales bacterium]